MPMVGTTRYLVLPLGTSTAAAVVAAGAAAATTTATPAADATTCVRNTIATADTNTPPVGHDGGSIFGLKLFLNDGAL